MLKLLDCIVLEHDTVTFLLAAIICLSSIQVMFLLLRRVDECAEARKPLWLIAAASVGGLGIWATHFVAMLAYHGSVTVNFDWLVTSISALVAVGGVLESLRLLGSKSRAGAILAALVLAGTVAAMHFLGMMAMQGLTRQAYDFGLMIGAVTAAIAVFWLAYAGQRSGVKGLRQVAPGLLVSAGIVVLHFGDMAASSFVVDTGISAHGVDDASRIWLVGAICAIAAITACGSVAAVLLDRYLTDLRGMTEAYIQGVAIVRDNRIIDLNARFREIVAFDGPVSAMTGMDPEKLLLPTDGQKVLGNRAGIAEATLVDGPQERSLEFTVRTLEYRGRPTQVLAVRDLTATRQAQRQIEHLANHDPLTGLANRTLLNQRLERAISVAGRSNASLAVLALDLDRFKAVNDLFGHSAGDQVLKTVAAILRECINDVDTIARIGGDEFIIVQVGQSQPKAADQLARNIQRAFKRDFNPQTNPMSVGVSIGVALYPDDGENGDALRHCADIALYRAKSTGRGITANYSTEMDQELRERRRMEAELRQAIRRKQLRTAFQPLVTAETGKVVGYEALLRWHHPDLGEVPPSIFIPIAEESGAINTMGEWVLRSACRTAAQWSDELSVAVNVSAVQFRRRNFADRVFAILQETGLAAHRLELEITESVLLQDEALSRDMLHALKAHGVRIVIDDFGTGYSSLSNLRTFQFDKIKIDRSFIAAMSEDKHARAIVRSIADLGRNINVPVLAEGVESKEQQEMIAADGCTQAQGYFFGRPSEITDAPAGNVVSLDTSKRRA
ncbi:bifunctional diguanylate cyclase/phosphodiesterase [Devosia riboflavina]